MIITKLQAMDKGKIKVYIDEEYHFILYPKDIKVHQIEENHEITDETYKDVYNNTVLRRAKQKAVAILKYMDRTEQELVTKLKQSDYTDNVISEVITYMNNYHYLDDNRYAVNFIRAKKNKKSKRQLYLELSQKGISKECIEQAFFEEYKDEEIAIQKAIAKKCKNIDFMTEEEKLKLIASLYRKGFQLDNVKKVIRESM